ncbi:hypothetical protein TruAng_010403 [Truncatella angustata]|nr:hypothetical protein TruAng_010403 [Truncatella angustata]
MHARAANFPTAIRTTKRVPGSVQRTCTHASSHAQGPLNVNWLQTRSLTGVAPLLAAVASGAMDIGFQIGSLEWPTPSAQRIRDAEQPPGGWVTTNVKRAPKISSCGKSDERKTPAETPKRLENILVKASLKHRTSQPLHPASTPTTLPSEGELLGLILV